MAIANRYRRSLLDRLVAPASDLSNGLSLTYSLEELRLSVARDIEALLNTRCAFDFEQLKSFPHSKKSIVCVGIRDFVGRSLNSSESRTYIRSSLAYALETFEPRLRNIEVELYINEQSLNSLSFSIRALLMTHPSAEPVAFDALLQPNLSRFSVVPAR